MLIIHKEEAQHAAGVRRVEEKAFGGKVEADLCESLQARGAVTLSLVALEDGEVVGHVLFSPVTIKCEDGAELLAEGMGPLAVLPSRQKQGIGARLINAGLEEMRQRGAAAVVVLGSEDYYPRFGFEPASRYGIRFQDENVPAQHFMIIELRRGVLEGHSGVAVYEPEFNEV